MRAESAAPPPDAFPAWRLLAVGIGLVWLLSLVQPRTVDRTLSIDPWALAGVALTLAGVTALVLDGSWGRGGRAALVGGVALLTTIGRPMSGPLPPRAAVAGLALLLLPLLYDLAREFLPAPPRRTLRMLIVLCGAILALSTALTYDPFQDLACTIDCPHEAILPVGWGTRAWLATASAMFAVLVAVLLAGVGITSLRHGRATSVSLLLTALGALTIGVCGAAAAALELVQVPSFDDLLGPRRRVVQDGLALGLAIGAFLLAMGLAADAARSASARVRVRRVVSALEAVPAPGSLGASLAAALRDPSLRVEYWAPGVEAYVDSDGLPCDPSGPMPEGRRRMPVERDGMPIARVDHRSGLTREELMAGLSPSALIALDNERLRAVSRARLREIQASRARIVAVADAERRRIERDLHDGAQQRLLAIAIQLRLARSAPTTAEARAATVGRAGPEERAAALEEAEHDAVAAIELLRSVARGIYPAVLGEAGLGAALRSLAAEAVIPMEVRADVIARSPASVEACAYAVVAEVLDLAVRAACTSLTVTITHLDRELRLDLEASVPTVLPEAWVTSLEDRAGAAGGTVVRWVDAGPMKHVEVRLPCA